MLLSCSCCYHYSKFLLPLSTEAFSQHWSFFLSTTQHGTPTQHTHMTHPHDTPTRHTHTTQPHDIASQHTLTSHPHDSPARYTRTAHHPQDTPKQHTHMTHPHNTLFCSKLTISSKFGWNWWFFSILPMSFFAKIDYFSNFSPGLIKINSCSTDIAV